MAATWSRRKTVLRIAAFALVCADAMLARSWREDALQTQIWRAKEALYETHLGLETYGSFHGSYPASLPMTALGLPAWKLKSARAEGLSIIDQGGPGRTGMTTPVAYLTSQPMDACDATGKLPLAYWTDSKRYLIFSTGPDGHFTIQHPESALKDWGGPLEFRDPGLLYDPSNGTTSEGDIVEFGKYDRRFTTFYDPENGSISFGIADQM